MIIKGWQSPEQVGVIDSETGRQAHHKEPFQLRPENYTAFELYYKIAKISDFVSIEYAEKEQKKVAIIPTFSAINTVFEIEFASGATYEEYDALMEKLALIKSFYINRLMI